MVNEAIARLEAKLRGWVYDDDCMMHHPHCIFQTNDGLRGWHQPATDPATPEGREWWCEALKITVEYDGDFPEAPWNALPASLDYGLGRESRSAAIIAAIKAAALAAQDK